jgi:organic hydroperoxide reductase OsmC/OhrA
MKTHHYSINIEWTGNEGKGTFDYQSYNRSYILTAQGKSQKIMGSSDPSFLGDPTKYNPEDLFISSLSACHMLWYLHLCSVYQIIVTDYVDRATGLMEETETGSGKFKEVTLHPIVTVESEKMIATAKKLHAEANKMCFIANSCNFKIHHNPQVMVKEGRE